LSAARKLTTVGGDRGRTLADFLAQRLGLSPRAAADLVRAGAVYVGRKRVEQPEFVVDAGQRVAVHEVAEVAESTALSIVHRDDDVLVVDKPAGVASQATRESSAGALDRIVAEMEPGARLLHRLDRDASGLVLFTRTEAAQRRFAEMLRHGRLERSYVAAAWGHLASSSGRFERAIGPDPRDRRRMSAGHGRPARTSYRVVRRGRGPGGSPTTLVAVELETGRTHQIRVHLADAGHPLCGDRLYGPAPPPEPVARLCLHAHRLAWPDAPAIASPLPPMLDEMVR
jgi:23S rRNA pseudouridine1911/1915/1917 synthase